MKILQVDSPLMKMLSKFADLAIINLITVVLVIPVITAGPALTALHYCTLKIVRDEEQYMIKQYFHSFKDNFRQGAVIGVLLIAYYAFFGVDLYFLYQNVTEINSYIFWGLVAVTFIITFVSTMTFPVLAKFANTIFGTIRAAFVFSIRQFPKTLAAMIVSLLPFFIAYMFRALIPLCLCFCFSAPALLSALMYNKAFKKLEDDYLEKHPLEDPSKDDEHIFSDEPYITETNDAE